MRILLKIFLQPKFFLGTRFPGSTTICRSDDDVDDVVGGLRGGGFRVLVCADTESEDPPWRAPIFVNIVKWGFPSHSRTIFPHFHINCANKQLQSVPSVLIVMRLRED